MNSKLQLSKINLTVAGIKAFIKNNQLSLVETATLENIIALVSENSEDSRKNWNFYWSTLLETLVNL